MAAGGALAARGAAFAANEKPVRVGSIGLGRRGASLLETLLAIPGVQVPAVCDVAPDPTANAQALVEKARGNRPEAYGGPEGYRRLLARDDLDAVVIATPWQLHTPMAVEAMRARKCTAVEVPAALTLDECWALVNTSESTGTPCMMLENWSFRRDNLAVLKMIRQGLLGEIVHCHCAHSHDCIDHWFFDEQGNDRWPAEFLIKRNADQYPTHSLGPVLSWMDIPCGDNFAYVTSTATESRGINAYFARRFGPAHPAAKRKYAQGDIVTTVVRTERGRTIVINYDMQLPRPYDNRWMIQGTLGLYDEPHSAVYLEGRTRKYHEWEPFAPYQTEFDHSWWRTLPNTGEGHGGTDLLELLEFVNAVRNRTQTPLDVYDAVVMSSIVPLSEESIRGGSVKVAAPDFTRGKWKSRKPSFALEG